MPRRKTPDDSQGLAPNDLSAIGALDRARGRFVVRRIARDVDAGAAHLADRLELALAELSA